MRCRHRSHLPRSPFCQYRVESPREPRDAAGWVATYNARDFGQPGVQRVSIELTRGPNVTRRFTVVNAWRADSHRVDSVYFLEAPPGMAGTAYRTRRSQPALQIWRCVSPPIRTAAGPDRCFGGIRRGAAGSDFAYKDFRKRLPMQGTRTSSTGTPTSAANRPRCWMSGGRTASGGAPACGCRADSRSSSRRSTFHAPGDDRPYKRFRVNRFRVVHGVRSAERMTMTATMAGRR